MSKSILHLFADHGIEDEVLHTFGDIIRVGIDPIENPYSDVVQGDATQPPVNDGFDLVFASPPCQRFSRSTPGTGNPDNHDNLIAKTRKQCKKLGEEYIIENVPEAPLNNPVKYTGGMFGLPIHYGRCFETSFETEQPETKVRWNPQYGPLANQGEKGRAWVGKKAGWHIAKGYSSHWQSRPMRRHAVPAPYVRRLLYHWLDKVAQDDKSVRTACSNKTLIR